MYPLLPTDTIPALVIRMREAREASRKAKYERDMKGAKTNLDVLIVQGVVTCDDGYGEMVRSFQWEADTKYAQEHNISLVQARDIREYKNDVDYVISILTNAAQGGETEREHTERVHNTLDAAPLGTKENGKPCKHVGTKKERGWFRIGEGWVCCRCGTEATVTFSPATITEQSKIAKGILDNRDQGVIMEKYRELHARQGA